MKYQQKKERMERDPDFKRRVYAQQVASRARRREAVREQSDMVCGHPYSNGRHCWRSDVHTHGGQTVDPMAAEIVAG